MATLIGTGSHGHDIWATIRNKKKWDWIAHHSYYEYDAKKYIIGINDPQLRAKVATELEEAGKGYDRAWIHPETYIKDCTILSGAHVNYGTMMVRTSVGNHTTISPGVIIAGNVEIGDRCLIGLGARICDRVTIGDDVTIGAGAVVLPESVVDSGATIVGVPAKHLATGVHVK
jgi:NDP-sugar pyrophosphorylase family protein